MTVKKSATKPEENNRTMPRRTIFAVKPIRRQRDHPVVAAAGDELYQQNNYSYQISVPPSHRLTQAHRYNTTQAIAPSSHLDTNITQPLLPSYSQQKLNPG